MFEKIYDLTEIIWGAPLTIVVIAVGIYLSYCCKFIQFTKIKEIFVNFFRIMFSKKSKNSKEDEDDRKTLSLVLAGTIGTGNIAGIASAISVGGPGAIFWMWIISFLSMATKFCEVALSVKYKEKNQFNEYIGGPMYYIKHIKFKKIGKILAVIYSIALLVYVITDSCFAQMNTLATTINEVFNIPLILVGIVLIVLSIFIINLGINKISKILKKVVPIMTIFYIFASLIVIILNITKVPASVYEIIKYAFSSAPMMGGFTGATVMLAISKGAARGIFANEAGLGTSSTVYATSDNSNPYKQGLWGIFEVSIVSFGTCTITALLILVTGVLSTGNTGSILVLNSFEKVYGKFGKVLLAMVISMFAYTSYIGYYVEFKTCINYLFGEKSFKILKWFYYIPVVFAVLFPIDLIWALADISVGFIIIPNLIALVLLKDDIKNIIYIPKTERKLLN